MDRRALNFSKEEIEDLLTLVDEFKYVVECKKNNTVLWKDKEAIWANISKTLEELGFPHRTAKQLRDKWGNLKKEFKKKYADEKIESLESDNGQTKSIKLTSIDDKIKSILMANADSNTFEYDECMQDLTESQEEMEDCKEELIARVQEFNHATSNIFHNKNWALRTPKVSELRRTEDINHYKEEEVTVEEECLRREMIMKEEEYTLKLRNLKEEHALKRKYLKEEHEIKMKKHKIELQLLELELKKRVSS